MQCSLISPGLETGRLLDAELAGSVGVNDTPTVLVLMPLATQRGGAELLLSHLLRNNRGQGIQWNIVFLQDGPMVSQIRDLGIDVAVIPSGRLRGVLKTLKTIFQITRHAKACNADFIFSWMPKAHIYGGIASLLIGVPCGWFQHGTPSRRSLIDRLTALLPARMVLACSKASAEAQGRIWPLRSTLPIHPGVEIDQFDAANLPSPAECRRELGLPAGGPLIGIVGRLQRWKGFHVLVQAMPAIIQSQPDARFVLVGGQHDYEPDYPEVLRKLIKSLGLADRVVMAGAQLNIPYWMQAMDVVVHASDREPFGIVIVEAMSLGKPVVATDDGGPIEIVTNNTDGLLTPFGDAFALATAVNRYLSDPPFAKAVGENARRRAQQFSTKAFAAKVNAAIMSCLQAKVAKRRAG